MKHFSLTLVNDQFPKNPLKDFPKYMHFQCINSNITSVGQTPVVETDDMETLHTAIVQAHKQIIQLPVYMYHDNKTWNLTTNSYKRTNAELVGYIFVNKGEYKIAHGIKSLSKTTEVKIFQELGLHLSRYDQFIHRDVDMVMINSTQGGIRIHHDIYDLADLRLVVETFLNEMEQ